MNSTEKVLAFLEELVDRPDEDLAGLPIPPYAMRMALAGAGSKVPQDPEQLDAWALQAAQFCLSMRSDDALPYNIITPMGEPA